MGHDLDEVKTYFDSSQWLYKLLCYNSKSLGMHHGFWVKKTKNRHEAMLNENQAIVDLVAIKNGQKVLDAGCGVGGTAIYIAGKTGAQVTGISIVPREIKLAKKYSKDRKLTHLTNFEVQDYTKTNFKNNYFDVIYGVESICHCSPKVQFLNEAYRILKPGGNLIIADGYLSRKTRNIKENRIINDFKKAFALEEFITPKEMTNDIKKSGFVNLLELNKKDEVKPSVTHYYRLALYLKPLATLLTLFPIKYLQAADRNRIALQCEGEALKTGLVAYYIHYAEKPF